MGITRSQTLTSCTDWADHYWAQELPTGTPLVTHVALPEVSDYFDQVAVESILAAPASVRGYQEMTRTRRVETLQRFAEYLEKLRSDLLPETLRSRAARFRFLVWSLPFRLAAAALDPGVLGSLNDTEILARAREARQEWLAHLRGWQDDPWLSALYQREPRRFEHELRLLTHAWPDDTALDPGGVRRAPLILAERQAPADERDADHERIAREIAEAHLLPRGALLGSMAAFRPASIIALVRIAVTFALLLVAPLFLFAFRSGDGARWAALIELGVGLGAVIALPVWRDALLVLRLPAAAAAGALVLLSFTPRWWLDADAWRVGAGLGVAAFLYLVLEIRLHGVPRRHAFPRGLGIWLIGVLYAATLSIAILGFVAPSVAEDGQCLLGWWRDDPFTAHPFGPDVAPKCQDLASPVGAAPAGMVAFMTGWSLAVGLVAQVLWDDRPVTAPLGRLKRVRGGSP